MQLYVGIASLWRDAGAPDPLDAIEAMLEWLAYVRLGESKPHPQIKGELTADHWSEIRNAVTRALKLPPSHRQAYAFQRPGLFEQTRRIADGVTSVVCGKSAAEFMGSFLSFLMHAPQTGMRRSDIGAFVWPEYLSQLFPALLGKRSPKPVYVPYDSSGWLPLVLARSGWTVECEVLNEQTARIFGLFAFLSDWNLKVHVGDPLRRPSVLDGPKLKRFPFSAAIVTFGLRLKDDTQADPYQRFPVRLLHGEARQLAHMVAQTDGRVAVIVPEGFLFRSAGGERDYKEHLVRRGILSAVIRLPRSTFSPYSGVQTSLLILETQGRGKGDVLFIDASEEFERNAVIEEHSGPEAAISRIVRLIASREETQLSSLASYDQIREQDFNISVDRYVRSDEEQRLTELIDSAPTVELSDIAEIIRPQSFPSASSEAIQAFGEVALQDIEPDGQIRTPSKRTEVDERNLGKLLKLSLMPGDVLVSVRGRIGAVGMVREVTLAEDSKGWLASQAFVIVRLRETSPISQLALYRYLSSPLGQGLLQSVATGMTVPMVSMGDMKKLRIIVPSNEEQREVAGQYDKLQQLREQIRELEAHANELNAAVWPMTKAAVNNAKNGVH